MIKSLGGKLKKLFIILSLLLSLSMATVTDIDGNVYETVLIGEQLWMAENLKVTHYNDGDEIPTGYNGVEFPTEWDNLITGAYSDYGPENNGDNADVETNVEIYGRLYNWYAVDDSRGICPDGWHTALDEEWKQLEIFLGLSEAEADAFGWRGTNQGSQIAGSAILWNEGMLKNDPEFSLSGFNGFPGGSREWGPFYGMNGLGEFWCSDTDFNGNPINRTLHDNHTSIARRNGQQKRDGFSIRCIEGNMDSGCTDPEACNYNQAASIDNGSCEYPENNFDCNGNFSGCNENEFICSDFHDGGENYYCIENYEVCNGVNDCADGSDEENCTANGCSSEYDSDNDGICDWDDGDSYEAVQIGEQIWMTESLKVRHYSNGDEILFIAEALDAGPNGEWGSLSEGAFADYGNNPANSDVYGKLYNGFTVHDNRGVCPVGFHVPSEDEFESLHYFLDNNGYGPGQGGENAVTGGMLKEAGYQHWYAPNTGATNESGFTALPSGGINEYGSFGELRTASKIWTSTQANGTATRKINLWHDNSILSIGGSDNNIGYSIRCIANGLDYGCMDSDACNYNPEATIDADCEYAEDNYDCEGNYIGSDGCYFGFVEIDGNNYCQDDLNVLQDIIDLNGITSESSILDDNDNDGLWDDGDSVFEPLELGGQSWQGGRLWGFGMLSDGIYGSYGYTIAYLPESIYQLDDLYALWLSEVGLVEFPSTFGNLPSLQQIDVWRNNLTDDSFPESMNNLVNLVGISLDGNQLTQIPDFIQHSSNNLSYLYFGYGFWGTGNQIEYFPGWWSDTEFPNLWTLDLSNNYLKELPEEFNVYGLWDLTLWNNHLTSIDGFDWLCELSMNGTQLYLQDNYICNEISECIDEVIIGNQKGCEIVITDNPGAYEFTATISGGIVLSDGWAIADEGDMFAAFDEDGSVRGLAIQLVPPFGPYEGEIVYEMQLRSNDAGDILNFQYYDASENLVFDITETYDFVINDILGNVVEPVFYNINTEVEVDPSNWYEPEDGSVIIDMGWGVYHSIIINNNILSFMENGYTFYVIDLNGGLSCGSTGEIMLNQITYNQNIDTTYTINVLENINYCEFGGSLPGFSPGNTIYYKFSSPEGTFYIEPDEINGENIFNSDITIINSFDLSSISIDSNDGRSSLQQNNASNSRNMDNNRDEVNIKYEIIKNDAIVIGDYVDAFYLDQDIEPDNEYCYSVIIKDSNNNMIRTTDTECILIDPIITECMMGDVNDDSVLNVLDVVEIVSHIMGNSYLTDEQVSCADFNQDDVLNVIDIVMAVAIIMED